MDAAALQGVFGGCFIPAVAGSKANLLYVAGLYRQMVSHRRRQLDRGRYQTAQQMRVSLLKEIEARLVQRNADDLFTILAA